MNKPELKPTQNIKIYHQIPTKRIKKTTQEEREVNDMPSLIQHIYKEAKSEHFPSSRTFDEMKQLEGNDKQQINWYNSQ